MYLTVVQVSPSSRTISDIYVQVQGQAKMGKGQGHVEVKNHSWKFYWHVNRYVSIKAEVKVSAAMDCFSSCKL